MDATFLTAVWQAIGDYWPYIAGGSVPVLGGIATAILAFLRRPKSFSEGDQTYLDDEKLLSPPLRRPAYSDRMAYVLAELSDLAYYQFEGANGFINDAIEQAKRIDLTDESNIREFLDGFSAEMMSGHRLSLNAFSGILERSGFSLLRTINVGETQGFVSKRTAPGEPPYVVLAFRGTEKKISDWLTDLRCVPTVEGTAKVHSGFLEAFTKEKDSAGRTAQQVVEDILSRDDAKESGQPLPLFITGHSLGGALALLATKLGRAGCDRCLLYVWGASGGELRIFPPAEDPRIPYRQLKRRRSQSPARSGNDLHEGAIPGDRLDHVVRAFRVGTVHQGSEEFVDKLSGYRHHGDLRYLTDVAEGQSVS